MIVRPSHRLVAVACALTFAGAVVSARAVKASDQPVAVRVARVVIAPQAPQPLPTPSGMTGTVELPPLPVSPQEAALSAADATIRAAPPWLVRGTATDQARALQCLTTAIYYEAASEPDDGQAAVAQVILNRARHPSFPASVCGVVFQGSEKPVCQFSFACDGAMARVPMRSAWARAERVAARALAGYVFAPVGLATHYHTYAVTPAWNRKLIMTGMFGAHLFHRWSGWWGTAGAFRQAYAGGEPEPVPHARLMLASATAPLLTLPTVPTAATPPIAAAPTAPTPVATIQDAHQASGEPLAQYAESGESQILDKWKDSGKPIR